MSLVTYVLSVLRHVFAVCLAWAHFTRKRLSAYLNALSPHREVSLSAAQWCNEDILDEILVHLEPGSLASAALVCRSWLCPARRRLYREVQVDNVLVRKPDKLAKTLLTQPHLRSLIRRPVLRYVHDMPPSPRFFDWMALLPEGSLQSVEIKAITSSSEEPSYALKALLDSPAVRSTRRLIVRCGSDALTPERVNQILGMPHLQSLSIEIPKVTVMYLKDIVAFPNLRRLSISAGLFPPLICKLLQGLPSPLESFDLRSAYIFDMHVVPLRDSLQRHAPHIRHLSFLWDPYPTLYFMDDFVSTFPSLETLLCSHGLFTPLIFSRLPHSLVTLSLCTPRRRDDPFPSDLYASALQKCRPMLPLLRTLVVVNCKRQHIDFNPLPNVCKAEGISFQERAIGDIDVLA